MMVYYGMAVKRMGMLGMSVRGTDYEDGESDTDFPGSNG
jgi:hypothetical protein